MTYLLTHLYRTLTRSTIFAAVLLSTASSVHAGDAKAAKGSNVAKDAAATPPPATKVDGNTNDGYVVSSSTHIDFSETAIDGKMKTPEGFMLQGHQSSSLSQMVKLRSNFRNELNNSRSATEAIVK